VSTSTRKSRTVYDYDSDEISTLAGVDVDPEIEEREAGDSICELKERPSTKCEGTPPRLSGRKLSRRSFEGGSNSNLINRLAVLIIKMLEFEHIDINGETDRLAQLPLNSVITSLQSLGDKPISEAVTDNLEIDIRSVMELRMEKFRLLQERLQYRYERTDNNDAMSAQQNLNNLELQDLKAENGYLWQKVEILENELKHIKTRSGRKDRIIDELVYKVKVGDVQKFVNHKKIQRLTKRASWTNRIIKTGSRPSSAVDKEKLDQVKLDQDNFVTC